MEQIPVLIQLNGLNKLVRAVADLSPEDRDALATRYLDSIREGRHLLRERLSPAPLDHIHRIVLLISDYFAIDPELLTKKTRKREVVYARHMAMYLCRAKTAHSLKTIGNYFGRDHTTVIHAIKIVQALSSVYPDKQIELNHILGKVDQLFTPAQAA